MLHDFFSSLHNDAPVLTYMTLSDILMNIPRHLHAVSTPQVPHAANKREPCIHATRPCLLRQCRALGMACALLTSARTSSINEISSNVSLSCARAHHPWNSADADSCMDAPPRLDRWRTSDMRTERTRQHDQLLIIPSHSRCARDNMICY
jgi:hypothetical protein